MSWFKRSVRQEVSENIKLMTTDAPGGMGALEESIGGNAGSWARGPCWAANFYVDDHGLIKYFGNSQDVPASITRTFHFAFFRVGIDLVYFRQHKKAREGVIEIHLDINIPEEAKEVLLLTAREYNRQIKLDVEPVLRPH